MRSPINIASNSLFGQIYEIAQFPGMRNIIWFIRVTRQLHRQMRDLYYLNEVDAESVCLRLNQMFNVVWYSKCPTTNHNSPRILWPILLIHCNHWRQCFVSYLSVVIWEKNIRRMALLVQLRRWSRARREKSRLARSKHSSTQSSVWMTVVSEFHSFWQHL